MTYQSSLESVPTMTEEFEEDTAANHIEVIETVISSLETDQTAMVSHANDQYLWKFKYGTVEVMVQLSGTEDEDTLTVWAPVLNLPAKNEAQLMQKLLKMNWSETFEARFAIIGNEVVVVSSRTLEELTPAETSRIMTIVATIADDVDEPLQQEYGNV
ncbi:MAG: YbjN domain-containing protein [Thainema sp.]